jgi:hypothetical protein
MRSGEGKPPQIAAGLERATMNTWTSVFVCYAFSGFGFLVFGTMYHRVLEALAGYAVLGGLLVIGYAGITFAPMIASTLVPGSMNAGNTRILNVSGILRLALLWCR